MPAASRGPCAACRPRRAGWPPAIWRHGSTSPPTPPSCAIWPQTFNLTAERLSQLVESQGRFVADASHQLRTPLTALRLRLETLMPAVAPEARGKLDAALDETTRLARLVDSLLVLARSDASPRRVVVDLAATVAERTDSWEPAAHDRDVTLAVDRPGPTWVQTVPGALEQIVDNLVSNALDAAPPGTAVTVRIECRDHHVELHVIDDGPGMAPERRERMHSSGSGARRTQPGRDSASAWRSSSSWRSPAVVRRDSSRAPAAVGSTPSCGSSRTPRGSRRRPGSTVPTTLTLRLPRPDGTLTTPSVPSTSSGPRRRAPSRTENGD